MTSAALASTSAPTPFFSATQISQFDECQRKWAWKYIARLETPQSPAAALGDEVDKEQLQPYLTTGRHFDYTRDSGYIATAGLAYLPQPSTTGLEVQKHFVLPAATARNENGSAQFGYQGYLDLWLPSGGAPDLPANDTGRIIPVVGDFKTTGDINKPWIKTPATLATDVQAQLYATWAMFETGARAVDLTWLYFQTRGAKKAKRVHLRVHADHVAEQFLRIDGIAERMFERRRDAESGTAPLEEYPLRLPANPAMCEQYGGCPYRHKCNLSPDESRQALGAQIDRANRTNHGAVIDMSSTADLLAALKAKKAGVPPASSPAAPAAPPPMPPAPVAPASPAQPTPYMMREEDRAVPPALADQTPAALQSPPAPSVLGINPPESNLPPAPPTGAATSAAAPTTEAPKRRGRPPKVTTAQSETPSNVTNITVDGGTLDFLSREDTVTVTWGEETFSPVQYNSFRVGPFSVTARVQPGESRGDALRRISAELFAFAIEERANKAEAFKRALGR